jgi:hypothetical protein
MRLTLRTLLAYLDDTLQPAEARLIGQKIAESEPAQELIERIKQVTRRRRLTTPPESGPGAKLDANTIAEYLDNVLPPDQLAELEETCLGSDVHLAEVAACHQILTLVLGEPATVPPTARQRMYAVAKGREAMPGRKIAKRAIGQGIEIADEHGEEADETLLLGLPLYRRSRKWLAWLVPLAAVCLFVGAGIAIWMAIRSGWQASSMFGSPKEDESLAVATQEKKESPEVTAKKTDGPETKAPPLAKPAEDKTKPPPVIAKKSEPAAQAKPVAPSLPPKPSNERRDLGKAVLAAPVVLLERPRGDGPWQRLKPESRIGSTDYLLSLPGYKSDLRLESGVQLTLWGNLPEFSRIPVLESAVTLHAGTDADLDFTLHRGRVVVSNRKKGPASVRVRFQDEVWTVKLLDPDSEVALELQGVCLPYTKETGGGDPQIVLGFLVLKGQAGLKIRYEEFLLPANALVTWDNNTGFARQPNVARLPGWWTGQAAAPNAQVKGMLAALDGLTNRLVAKDRFDIVLAESLQDADLFGRVLAVRCLGAMEELSSLVDALSDEKHAEVRVVAIGELRHFLGLSAKNDAKLVKVLKQKNYSEERAQTIPQLLHGYSEQQWTDPNVRASVVEYLNVENLAIRQITVTLLLSLMPEGQNLRYDPAGESRQREQGYQDWRDLVLAKKPPVKKQNGVKPPNGAKKK